MINSFAYSTCIPSITASVKRRKVEQALWIEFNPRFSSSSVRNYIIINLKIPCLRNYYKYDPNLVLLLISPQVCDKKN